MSFNFTFQEITMIKNKQLTNDKEILSVTQFNKCR